MESFSGNPATEAVPVNPVAETEAVPVNPVAETEAVPVNPVAETEAVPVNPVAETEAVPVNPVAAPGGETGREEPKCKSGLGEGPESYPVRLGERDCSYYLRTGFCGYGHQCHFNHPSDRKAAKAREVSRAGGGEHPEHVGKPTCQYYMRTGTCSFGASCKKHHPKFGTGSSSPVTLNINGYPLRPGEQECSYYGTTGQCKFGVTCKFHHPQPAGFQPQGSAHDVVPTPAVYPSEPSPSAQPSQQYGMYQGNYLVASPGVLPGAYVEGSFRTVFFPSGVYQVPSWSPYTPTVGPTSNYGISQLSPSTTVPCVSLTSSASPFYPSKGTRVSR